MDRCILVKELFYRGLPQAEPNLSLHAEGHHESTVITIRQEHVLSKSVFILTVSGVHSNSQYILYLLW